MSALDDDELQPEPITDIVEIAAIRRRILKAHGVLVPLQPSEVDHTSELTA